MSTEVPDGDVDTFIRCFKFLMDCSMLGVGTGFDTKGKGKFRVYKPNSEVPAHFLVEDSREGWVNSTGAVLQSYLKPGHAEVLLDYSKVRGPGLPLKVFGGYSSGPEPLKELHQMIKTMFDLFFSTKERESCLGSREIVDLMNFIGKCVVSGNIRRTAEIAFGDFNDSEFINLKNYEQNPERMEFGWVSNNSIFAETGMDYSEVASRIVKNGEPGLAWLENMKNYSRMSDPADYKDSRAAGGNPCLEQTLESFEMCCLVETFPDKH